MSSTRPISASRQFLDQATVFATAPDRAGDAAGAGDYRTALAQADRLELAVGQLRQAILRDVLAEGADWWAVADLLGTHPQQAFQTCAHLADHRTSPAGQRPDLAVVLTAGLAAEHDMCSEYGIDVEDLSPDHSLHGEPGVRRIRDAADLVGDDVWITVTIPAGFEGAESDPTPGEDAIQQWISVVVHPDELTWLREALEANADDSAASDRHPDDSDRLS